MKHNKYIKQRKESQEFDFEIDQNDIPQKYNIMLLESPKNNAQNGKKVKEPDEEFFDLDQYDPNEEGIKNVGITIINKRNSFEVPEKEQTYNTKNQQEDDMYRSPVAVTTHQKNQDEIDEDISMNHQQDEIYTENTTTNKKVLKSKQINNNKISNSAKQTTAITYSKSSVIKNDYTQLNVPTDNDIEEEYQQDFESLENDNQIEQENNNNKQSKVEKTLQHPPRNLQKQTVYSRRTQKSLDSETKKSQSNTSRKKDVSIVAEEGTRGKYERQMQKLFAAYGTKNSPTNIELFPQSKIKTINDKIKDLVKKLNSELNELLNKNTLLLQAVNDNSKQKARNSNARNLIDQISNLDQLRKNNNKVIERLQLELQKLVSRESEVKEPFYEINLMKNIESYLQKKREVEAAINKMKLNVSKESKKLTRVTQRKQKEEFTAVTQQQKVEYLHLVKEETKHQKHLAQLDSKIETFSTKYESLEEKYKQLARTVSQKAVETKPQITLQEQYQQLKLKQSIQQKNLNNSQKILQRKYDRLQQQISLLYRQNKNYNLQIKNIYNQIDYVMKHSIIAIEKIKQNPKFVTPIKESLMIILKSLENQPVDNVFDVINESLTRKSHRSHIFSKKEKREHSQLSAVVTKSQEKNQYKPKNFKLRQKDDHKSRSTKPKFNPKINQLEKQQSHPHLQAFNSQIQTKRNLLEQQQLNNKKISKVKDQNNNSNKNIKIQDHNKKIEKQFQKSELKNNKNEDSFFPLKSPVSKDYNNNIQHQRPEVQMKLESQQIDLSKPSFMFRRKIGNINNNINNNLNPPPYESGHNKSISQIMPQQHEQQIQQPKQKETDINLAPRMMRIQRNNRSISSKNNLSKQQQQYNPTGITITPPPIILNNQNFKLLNKNDSSDKTTINNENNNSNVNSSIIDNSNNPLNLSNSSEIPKPNFLRRFNLRKNNQQQQQINSYNPSLLQQPTQKPTTNYNYDKKLYQQTTTNNKNFQKFVDKKITLPNNNTNMNSQQQQQNNQNNNSFLLSRNNNNKVDNNNTNNIQQYDNNSYSKNDNNNNNNVNNMNNLNNNINNNNNNQTKQNIEKANNNNNSNNNNNVSLNKDKDSESITKITNPYAQNILNQQSNKNIHHHQREGKLKKNKIEGIKQKIDIYEAANEEPIVNNNILAKTPNRQQNLHPSRNLQSNNNTKNQEVDDINKLLGIKPKNSDPEDDLLFGSKPVQKKKFGGKRQEDFFGFDV